MTAKSLRLALLSSAMASLGGATLLATYSLGREPPAALDGADATALPICSSPRAADPGLRFPLVPMLRYAQTEVSKEAQAAKPAPEFADADPPLWDGLSSITYKITTSNAEAQKYFDQGLRMAYAFNHDEARRAFRKGQKLDPDCAMCFWGEALVLGPNINLPMMEEAVAPAYAAAQKAKALIAKAAPHEKALIEALALRYAAEQPKDRAPLDRAYADAMSKSAAAYPDDQDIAVLYAEAVMDLSPWDYWKKGGAEPNPQSVPIVPTLERVLAKNPDHPGAIHFYIHAVEASDRPERAEPYADRLRGVVPRAGHLVHMPSHIYYRLGRYLDALADNKQATAVDEAYLQETNAPMGVYRLGYYPHNVHFVMAAAQMSGDGPTVIAAAGKLDGLIPAEAARGIAMVQPVKLAPYFAHAQFSPPEVILALPDPGEGIPYVKAMWHYARGVALAARKDAGGAKKEADAITALEASGDFTLLKASGVPALEVMKLARAVIEARIAQAAGDAATAAKQFEAAAAMQDELPYTEPPYWYYPVRQSLAAALLQAGRYDEAEEQFRRALRRAPNNGWSYFGLGELYRARGRADDAKQMDAQLAKTWIGDRGLLQLSRL